MLITKEPTEFLLALSILKVLSAYSINLIPILKLQATMFMY
jgi:hypothetical protein